MLLSVLLILVIFIIIFSCLIGSYNETYWRKRGVIYIGGKNVFAFIWSFFTGERGMYAIFGDAYKEYSNEPAIAVPSLFTPSLFIIDPTNIRYVLNDNFQAFYHRGVDINKNDLLSDNVLFMNGNRWRLVRQKMTPLFTTAKLKSMFYIMDKSATDFVDYINKNIDKKTNTFEDVCSFCCAAIGGAVFGIKSEVSTFDSPFFHIATTTTKPSLKGNIKFAINSAIPTLFRLLRLKQFGEHEALFINAFRQVLDERRGDNKKRYDFPEIAINLQKNGLMIDESTGFELYPSDELMAAQGFFFLIAGVEPTAQGIFASLFELAKRPDLQARVQEEIDAIIHEHNNQISYDAIMKITCLDKVIDEALRMHPPISLLARRCTQDTILPAGNIRVDKGTQITIPILALHNDPKYFPNPEVFDPERFTPEMIRERPKSTYLPFGDGGRLCIGQRYAYLQMKTGIVHLLRNFNVKVDDVNQKMTYLKAPVLIRPTKDINFYYERRKKNN